MSEVPDLPKPADGAELPDVRGPADLRCSDVDRERVAEALRKAAGDGRLTLTELEERLEATFGARTYGDLQPITRDLPQGPYPLPGGVDAPRWQHGAAGLARPAGQPAARRADGVSEVRSAGEVPPDIRITSILGEEKRRGRWEVPARIDVTSIMADVTLDFTDAIVRTDAVDIHAAVVIGEVTIIVPEGIDVRFEQGVNILGDRKLKLREPVTPGAPIYRIHGMVLLGQVTVRPPRERRRHLGH